MHVYIYLLLLGIFLHIKSMNKTPLNDFNYKLICVFVFINHPKT